MGKTSNISHPFFFFSYFSFYFFVCSLNHCLSLNLLEKCIQLVELPFVQLVPFMKYATYLHFHVHSPIFGPSRGGETKSIHGSPDLWFKPTKTSTYTWMQGRAFYFEIQNKFSVSANPRWWLCNSINIGLGGETTFYDKKSLTTILQ